MEHGFHTFTPMVKREARALQVHHPAHASGAAGDVVGGPVEHQTKTRGGSGGERLAASARHSPSSAAASTLGFPRRRAGPEVCRRGVTKLGHARRYARPQPRRRRGGRGRLGDKVAEALPSRTVRDHGVEGLGRVPRAEQRRPQLGEYPERLVDRGRLIPELRFAGPGGVAIRLPTSRSWVSTTASARNIFHSTAQTARIARRRLSGSSRSPSAK